ncbi:MAG: Hsp33 family molecular chaperone HslO [Myxococcota bacterium]|jgi:molecular chaperone Hsp33|nr:Hsp33 family molecular chaperone HslO [Myxococcota bacterium]
MSLAADMSDAAIPEGRARLVRTISREGGIAVRAIVGSNLVAEAMNRRPMAPTAANALGRALMGGVLIAVGPASPEESLATLTDAEHDEREAGESVQLQFRGDGPLGSIVVIADDLGRVRGTVSQPDTNLVLSAGTPDVARAIGLGALRVIRSRPEWREPYSGAVPLVSGEIASDLTLYLTESEQTPSAMGLGVAMTNDESAVVAAGFLVQILPDALPEEVDRVEANVRSMPTLSQLALSDTHCDEIIDLLLRGLGSRERHTSYPVFRCSCTRERARSTLMLLGEADLREIVIAGSGQQVRCEFCARAHEFSASDIDALFRELRGQLDS